MNVALRVDDSPSVVEENAKQGTATKSAELLPHQSFCRPVLPHSKCRLRRRFLYLQKRKRETVKFLGAAPPTGYSNRSPSCTSKYCMVGQKCSPMIAEVALYLITLLCKLGGAAIVSATLKHLPDMRGRIGTPPINRGVETIEFHELFVKSTKAKAARRSCALRPHCSSLRDWPSCLKVQLLQLDVGIGYLLSTGWVQEQLQRYEAYAHDCGGEMEGAVQSDGADGKSVSCINNSADVCGGDRQQQRKQRQRASSASHVYVTIMNAILVDAFWYYPREQQQRQSPSAAAPQHQPSIECPLIIPDAQFNHVYLGRSLSDEQYAPTMSSNAACAGCAANHNGKTVDAYWGEMVVN